MTAALWTTIRAIAAQLDAAGIPYQFLERTALLVQGVALPESAVPNTVEAEIQWDYLETAHALFTADGAGPIRRDREHASFSFRHAGVAVAIGCTFNTVVAADPDRIPVIQDGQTLWAKSVYFYRKTAAPDDPQVQWISQYLAALQTEVARVNAAAWSHSSYEAWIQRHGSPAEAAERLKQAPASRLSPLIRHLGDLTGKKVINLLGSHGTKGVAMALLGADVTVVDISPENGRYASELAAAAGVPLRFVVADVLALPESERRPIYDLCLMELGILHYFVDLHPLTHLVADLLKPGGRFVLQDFHPVSTKLISMKGKKHKVSGNYFHPLPVTVDVAYTKYLPGGPESGQVKSLQRKWTLGEILTAVADSGLMIRRLEEEPNTKLDELGVPKTFTLVATKRTEGLG